MVKSIKFKAILTNHWYLKLHKYLKYNKKCNQNHLDITNTNLLYILPQWIKQNKIQFI